MGGLDIFFASVLAYSGWRGFSMGVLRAAASAGAPAVGLLAALRWSDEGAHWVLRQLPSLAEVVAPAASLAGSGESPAFVRFIVAPVLFVLATMGVKLAARLASALLGLTDSLVSKVAGAAVAGATSAVLLGTVSLLIHGLVPEHTAAGDGPGRRLGGEVGALMARMDGHIEGSALGPPLRSFAGAAIDAAIEIKESEALTIPGQSPFGR